ncbi:MAG TPA: tetratricopeptide repeat protein [Terriglobia bacterium]|nr:tetratricopeptide repeat protein [Terriglobia bacterium]
MTACARFIILAFSLALPLPRPQGSPSKTDIPALLGSAEDALNRKDFAAAAKILQAVVQAQPDSYAAWFDLGFADSGLRQNDDAVKAYQRAIQLKPSLFAARLNLGILLVEMNQPAAATEHLAKAVELEPQNAKAHLYDGRALAQTGHAAEAEKQFQEALRLSPGLAIAHFDLAQLELDQKRCAEAVGEFQKSAGLDPHLAQAQLGMALGFECLKQEPEAIPHFEQYLAAKPDDAETRFHLAKVYLDQAKPEQAQAALEFVRQANPNLPGLAAALGDVYALLKKFPESEKYYRQALAATGAAATGSADLHRALGQTLLDEQKPADAEAEFRTALKLDPHNEEAAKGLASSLYIEKRYAEAAPLIAVLVRQPRASPGLYFLLATCYDHLRDRPQALAAYERFLSLSHGESPDQEWQAAQRAKLLRRVLGK